MATKILGIRLKEEDKKILEREAKRNGMTVADYVRNLAKLRVDLKLTISKLHAKSQ